MTAKLSLVLSAVALLAPSSSPLLAQSTDLVYTSVEPCRVVDTRYATTPAGPLTAGETRTFFLRGATRDYSPQGGMAGGCGVPGLTGTGATLANEAKAVEVNVVAVNPSAAGHIIAWASNHTAPLASILNFQALSPSLNIGNAIILPMCDELGAAPCAGGDISFKTVAGVHLVIDIVGYFRRLPNGAGSGLDADTVDGLHAASFMAASTDNWVNTTGDTMTGTLTLNPSSGLAWSTAADVDLRGRVMKGASTFIHTTGSTNTAIGINALGQVSTDTENTAVGSSALLTCTSGYQSVAVGNGALAFNNTGSRNIAIGYEAVQGPQGGSASGANNIGIGFNTLKGITSGSGNIALGNQAGQWIQTGGNNIIIGGDFGNATLADTTRIGGSQTRFFAAGIRGRTTGVNDGIPVLIDSAGQLGTTSSSIRVKDDVHDISDESAALFQLRPVTFRYKGQVGARHFGLIAEEVNEVIPELVVHSADGEIETVKYHELPALLLNELQKQQRKLRAQEELIAQLEARLARIEGK